MTKEEQTREKGAYTEISMLCVQAYVYVGDKMSIRAVVLIYDRRN